MSKTAKRLAKKTAKAAAKEATKPAHAGVTKPVVSAPQRAAAERLSVHFKAGRGEEALAALSALCSAGAAPSTRQCNQVITALGKQQSWRQALALLQQMRPDGAPGPAHGVPPSAVTYAAVLSYCGAAGEVETALRVLDWLRADGVAPDAVVYNACISACRPEAAQRLPFATALLQEARTAGLAELATFNALLGVQAAAGAWESARKLLASMPALGVQPNGASLSSAIAACATARQPEAALETLRASPAPWSSQAANAALNACERSGRWADALALLTEMEVHGPQPDDISLRTCVFACMCAQPPALDQALLLFRRVMDGEFPDCKRDSVTFGLLVRACDMGGAGGESALRLLAGVITGTPATETDVLLHRFPDWTPPPAPLLCEAEEAAPAAAAAAAAAPAARCVHHEPGWRRRPANAHDLRIWATSPGSVLPSPAAPVAAVRAEVPGVPGALTLSGVLTRSECAALVASAERMGYTPDEPLRGAGGADATSAQEAIDNCHWLVDESILGRVWARCKALLPQEIGGARLAGVNARWRLFRYSAGAVYRPHVDGAWPGSALGDDGRYVFDGFKDRWSKLTLLLYLNGGEDFGGGATVFYIAGGEGAGGAKLEGRGVRPREGCALVFPHGDTPGALVHEGSSVCAGGVKYVARTEVLYMKPG